MSELKSKDLKQLQEAYSMCLNKSQSILNESKTSNDIIKMLGTAASLRMLDRYSDKEGNVCFHMEYLPKYDDGVALKPIIDKITKIRERAQIEIVGKDGTIKITEPTKNIERDFDSRFKWAKNIVNSIQEIGFGKRSSPTFEVSKGNISFNVKVLPRFIEKPNAEEFIFILTPNGKWRVSKKS